MSARSAGSAGRTAARAIARRCRTDKDLRRHRLAHGHGCRAFYIGRVRGAEGRRYFPGNLTPSPPERGLRHFRIEKVPSLNRVVPPRWPPERWNFRTEAMRGAAAGWARGGGCVCGGWGLLVVLEVPTRGRAHRGSAVAPLSALY